MSASGLRTQSSVGTLPARPGALPARPEHSQDSVQLSARSRSGHPGQTVGKTGSRSGKPGRRFAVGTTGSPSGQSGTSRHLQPGCRCAGRDADGSARSRSGHPGRGRENRVAVITGSPSGQQGRRDHSRDAQGMEGMQPTSPRHRQCQTIINMTIIILTMFIGPNVRTLIMMC